MSKLAEAIGVVKKLKYEDIDKFNQFMEAIDKFANKEWIEDPELYLAMSVMFKSTPKAKIKEFKEILENALKNN